MGSDGGNGCLQGLFCNVINDLALLPLPPDAEAGTPGRTLICGRSGIIDECLDDRVSAFLPPDEDAPEEPLSFSGKRELFTFAKPRVAPALLRACCRSSFDSCDGRLSVSRRSRPPLVVRESTAHR